MFLLSKLLTLRSGPTQHKAKNIVSKKGNGKVRRRHKKKLWELSAALNVTGTIRYLKKIRYIFFWGGFVSPETFGQVRSNPNRIRPSTSKTVQFMHILILQGQNHL
jgi:hypothetical protein